MNKVKVTNRSNGFIGYTIPELGINRSFGPYESKDVDSDEIRRVAYQSGGQALIDAYFLIEDKELAEEFSPDVSVEPEYWMKKEEIIEMMLHGSQEQFLDFLDFCPPGSLETVKDLAVALPLRDTLKMDAIKEKTGMNVYNAIQNRDSETEKTPEKTVRRVAIEENNVALPKYRRVEK